MKEQDKQKPAPKKIWVKPSKSEVDKLIAKNLEGFARKGASEKHKGFWPTGHFNLDFAITQGTLPIKCDLATVQDFDPKCPGGIPRGRISEVFGEPGGGKSSLCLRVVGNAQKMGASCMWVDKEQSFVNSLARINGVDLKNVYMIDDPELCAEHVFDKLYIAVDSGMDLIVVDSVPALIPNAVMENEDSTKDTVALLARVMSKCIPKLTSLCGKTGASVVFINQIRQKPGVMFGPSETTPGGETLKFNASVRIQINKRYAKDAEVWREDENGVLQLVAQESLAFIRKTRFSKGLREGVAMPVYFEPYFPNPEQVAFDLGRQTQVIKVRNEVFSWKAGADKKIEGQGRKAFIDTLLAENLLGSMIADIKEEATEQGIVLPPELLTFKVVSEKEVIRKGKEQSAESVAIEAFLEEDAKKPQEADEPAKAKSDETASARAGKKKAGKPSGTNPLD